MDNTIAIRPAARVAPGFAKRAPSGAAARVREIAQ